MTRVRDFTMNRFASTAILLASVIALSTAIVAQISLAEGDTISVTRGDDPFPDGCAPLDCSLREAVNQANQAGGTVEVPGDMLVTLEEGPIQISGTVTIQSTGSSESLGVNGNGGRIFEVTGTGDATISGIKLHGGDGDTACGGGVLNHGALALFDVEISGNATDGAGGGICNNSAMTIDVSTISDNSAKGDPSGGGIMNSGTLTITNSIIADNTATGTTGGGDGAGIANTGTLTVLYSIITGNISASPACNDCSSGAGIDNDGTLTLEWSTVTNNQADAAAGLQNSDSATVRRTLFTGNQAGAILNSGSATMSISNSTISNNLGSAYPDSGVGGITNSGTLHLAQVTIAENTGLQFSVGGLFNNSLGASDYKGTIFLNNGTKNCNTAGSHISNGYNIVSDATCAQVASDDASTDANLGALQDNGGPTLTRLPNAGSPAINSGGPGCPSPDQRGAPRAGGCDAGAAEFGSDPPTPTPSPAPTATPAPTPAPTDTPTPPPSPTESPTPAPSPTIPPDTDADGLPDESDNCPSWHNPTQVLPPWPVGANDDDCDGFSNTTEANLVTDPAAHCNTSPGHDAWPPDLVRDGFVTIQDVGVLKPLFGSPAAANPRFDLAPGGPDINIQDVGAMKPVFFQSCND